MSTTTMSSTLPTTTPSSPVRLRSKRPPVPILLESFPTPPSHIPPTPTTTNPPPSRPPSVPLPPVPGPSRISEHDTIILLSTANRSRRSSKYSINSVSSNLDLSRRDSVASIASNRSNGGLSPVSPTPVVQGNRDSIASSRSARSVPPVSPHGRPSIAFSIVEEAIADGDGGEDRDMKRKGRIEQGYGQEQLTRMTISPIPLSDVDDIGDHRPSVSRPTNSPPSHHEPLSSTFGTAGRQVAVRPAGHHRRTANESISSIDIRNLPELDYDVLVDPTIPQGSLPARSHRPHGSVADPIDPTAILTSSKTAMSTKSDSSQDTNRTIVDAQSLHLQMRLSRSRSPSHIQSLKASGATNRRVRLDQTDGNIPPVPALDSSVLRATISPKPPPTSALPQLPHSLPKSSTTPSNASKSLSLDSTATSSREGVRSPSPDISTIISVTTRSRSRGAKDRRARVASATSSVVSSRSGKSPSPAPERERVDSAGSYLSHDSGIGLGVGAEYGTGVDRRRVSEGEVRSHKPAAQRRPSEQLRPKRDWDEGRNYPRDLGSKYAYVNEDENGEYDEQLERALEGAGSDGGADSDSSIDLHTPLPHLMVRHGLLSPHSKLLPGADMRSSTQKDATRPGSMMSVASTGGASVKSKPGIMKDERDTPMRRTRHRDGRLLRGGIGLTTGLGWSDSEDEDAPSPLTRRLSSINLSRRSSASSMHPSQSRATKHPLSHSYSSGTLMESPEGIKTDLVFDQSLQDRGEWAQRQRQNSNKSSSGPPPPTSWNRKSTQSNGRASTSSTGSAFSLEVTIPETSRVTGTGMRTPSRIRKVATRDSLSTDNTLKSSDEISYTPSTASTLSIPMPDTPQDDGKYSNPTDDVPMDKDKTLPPLPPTQTLRKYPAGLSVSRVSFPRARTYSATSSASGPPSTPSPMVPLPSPTPSHANVRPLQLPRHVTRIGSAGDRPAVPVPSVPTTPVSSRTAHRPSVGSDTSLPSPTSPDCAKPKPRTGTGMVYRTSSSRMKAPMQLASSVSASVGPQNPSVNGRMTPSTPKTPSGRKTPSSIPRGPSNGIPRAIAL